MLFADCPDCDNGVGIQNGKAGDDTGWLFFVDTLFTSCK
jgi:hypothetical protein